MEQVRCPMIAGRIRERFALGVGDFALGTYLARFMTLSIGQLFAGCGFRQFESRTRWVIRRQLPPEAQQATVGLPDIAFPVEVGRHRIKYAISKYRNSHIGHCVNAVFRCRLRFYMNRIERNPGDRFAATNSPGPMGGTDHRKGPADP
jgi:hypothetical protein